MDTERFAAAYGAVVGQPQEKKGIGTLSEKTLHAVLKRYIEPDTSLHEIPVGSFVADICRGDGVFEIQTGSFTPLRPKLEALLDFTDVTVVYPMAAIKYLSWIDPETGETGKPRRSPKKMKPIDSCYELVRIKHALDNPRFHLKLLMLEIHEYRVRDGRRSRDGKRGSHRADRLPVRLIQEIDIHSPRDFDILIPSALPEEFTIKQLAKAACVSYGCAQAAVSILTYLERVTLSGKKSRSNLYRRLFP